MGSSARDQIPGLQYASCEGDALLFTAGEGHDLVSRDMAESEPGEHGLGLALPDLFAVTGEAHAEAAWSGRTVLCNSTFLDLRTARRSAAHRSAYQTKACDLAIVVDVSCARCSMKSGWR